MHRVAESLRTWLAEPTARGLDLEDPSSRIAHRRIIRRKVFLRRIYAEWYGAIAERLAGDTAPALELGSGVGFLDERVANLITSDVVPGGGLHLVADAQEIPFAPGALRGIVLVNVFHHLPSVRRFLSSAAVCVRRGGVLVMVEPWRSTWSDFVYRHFHHEPFDSAAPDWEAPAAGFMDGVNGALPWIVFHRDRHRFEEEFPQWRLEAVQPTMPLRYLLSGGVSMRAVTPSWSFALWKVLEKCLTPFQRHLAMFAMIVLRRTHGPADR